MNEINKTTSDLSIIQSHHDVVKNDTKTPQLTVIKQADIQDTACDIKTPQIDLSTRAARIESAKACKTLADQEAYLKAWFLKTTGKDLNLDNPQTYNEKIQWMKLYDSTPLKTRLTDKYLVREWVKEKIGEKYLVPLLGVWDKFDDIDFDKLPQKFVLKCNHGCGMNIIVTDKSMLNKEDAKKKINQWMDTDFSVRNGLELHYKAIRPKIIAEEYLENDNNELYDYKIWCFNGNPEYIQFISERKSSSGYKMAFFDQNWEKQSFVSNHILIEKKIEKPSNLDEMLRLSSILSKEFSYVRVDFYRLNDGTLKFGEMTFTPASGTCKWNPAEMDLKMGQLINLPKK